MSARSFLFGRARRLPVQHARHWLWLTSVTAAYVVTGTLGIDLSVAHGVITPVWAPSGIALAALVIFGRSLWPAVALGAFITNATSGAEPPVAAAIALGNTLEAVAGAFLLEKVGFRANLGRVRDVLGLVVCGAGLSTLISATNGVAVLSLAGVAQGPLPSDWLLWWFGDAVGILLVTPLLLLAYVHRRERPEAPRRLEALIVVVCLTIGSAIVFMGGGWYFPYLIFPLLLWSALRFHQLGAAASSFLVGVMATWGTVVGAVPIGASSTTARVQLIQALVAVVAISLLVVGATLAERETANRTLEQTAARLSEAQALTHIGSWDWDLVSGTVSWSDELYRIFGLARQSVDVTPEFFIECVHPDDRAAIESTVRRACSDGRPFGLDHQIVLDDGGIRLIHSQGRVVVGDSAAEPVRVVGTAQDITEQRHAESLREDILSTVSHELRTPLASVLNFAVTLRERRRRLAEPATAEIVEQIIRQARRTDRLLSDLLEVDRLRHGRVVPMRQPTDLRPLVRRVVAAHRALEHPIAVSARPTRANVDAVKVERIVENLLVNAVRHTPKRTPITVRLEQHADDVCIVVEDEGPGIPDAFKTAVFDVFDRGPNAMSGDPGSGIGLSLVARFAALHGGRAWVEDSATGGASVRVLLPDCVLSPSTSSGLNPVHDGR